MASKTKKLEIIRDRKARKAGRIRKTKLENGGTTKSASDLFEDNQK